MSFRLALLCARRAATPAMIAWALIVLLFVIVTRTTPAPDWIVDQAPERLRGLWRADVWSLFLVALAPVLVAASARTLPNWRKRDAPWLGARAISKRGALASAWLGTSSAASLFVLVFALCAELGAAGDGPGFERVGALAGPQPAWIDGEQGVSWIVTAPATQGEERARVELGLVGGAGAAAEIVLRVRREGTTREGSARIGNRGALEVELPQGAGELEFALLPRDASTHVLVLSDGLERWRARGSERWASVELCLRVVLALAAWSALTLGLSAWLSPASAVLGTLAAWVWVWWDGAPRAWMPGGDLFDALAAVELGRIPSAIAPESFAVAVVCVWIGIELARSGLRDWSAPA